MNERLAWVLDNAKEKVLPFAIVLLIGMFIGMFIRTCPQVVLPSQDVLQNPILTFNKVANDDVVNMTKYGYCDVNGTPVVRMFSTTWCPHCQWAGPIFDQVAAENQGKYIFEHVNVEGNMTPMQMVMFRTFSKDGSIPLYTFGCSYYRIGNEYETIDDKALEKTTFEAALAALDARKIEVLNKSG